MVPTAALVVACLVGSTVGLLVGFKLGTSSPVGRRLALDALQRLHATFAELDERNPGASILASRAAAIVRAMLGAVATAP